MTVSPRPASSVIVRRGEKFLLVRRANPPAQAMYAFPGGKAEEGETAEQAAIRELAEETGLVAASARLFAVYDLIDRDDSGEIASFFRLSVFQADVDGEAVAAAADDADDLGWYALEEIRAMNVPTSVLECAERLGRPG
ncbi:NUDIX domain-containing protein [Martelella lutilitoris]|uniref:NUDIX domain-containing protein n=1 Tax=Martelella lutilitoris TaxID=2583532 RepID=A0A5C4JM54_9HYPH|nr:NUDIX domain-containing protein [Martelella lutilitoris]TNB46565.1 NUDIX domain-containing protein [Martelella lutilitoris]